MEPETLYTRLGTQHVAYQVMGSGPVDVVWTAGRIGSMEGEWADPEAAAMLRRIASFCRLIRYDTLGTGSSDPVPLEALPPLERTLDELLAVMDAAHSEHAAIFAGGESAPLALLAASSRPDRVLGLLLMNATARFLWAEDYPEGIPEEAATEMLNMIETDIDRALDMGNPSRANDPAYRRQRQAFVRLIAGPGALRAYFAEMFNRDVRSLLPAIHVPTLVLHKQDNALVPVELGRRMAGEIPGSKFVIVPGGDSAPFWEHPDAFVTTLRTFLQELQPEISFDVLPDRVMSTVLFTDIVSSTERAQEAGDSEWRSRLELHDGLSRQLVEMYQGRLVKLTGDGIMARFDTPGRGILSASAMSDQLGQAGLPIRAGIHTGEVELRGDDLGGVGVHIAARVMSAAGPGEVLVSRTVRDLVVGSQFRFEDRGTHLLKGIEGDWQLFALVGT